LAEYARRIRRYPPRPDGKTLPFRRLFMVARKPSLTRLGRRQGEAEGVALARHGSNQMRPQ
jgi:hypothetical protein